MGPPCCAARGAVAPKGALGIGLPGARLPNSRGERKCLAGYRACPRVKRPVSSATRLGFASACVFARLGALHSNKTCSRPSSSSSSAAARRTRWWPSEARAALEKYLEERGRWRALSILHRPALAKALASDAFVEEERATIARWCKPGVAGRVAVRPKLGQPP